MKKKKDSYPVRLGLSATGAAGLSLLLLSITAGAQEDEDPVFDLSPFEVSGDQAVGYYATNAVSATKTNVPIQDIPMNIQVMTREFIEDVAAVSLEDVVRYSASLNTSTNEPGRFVMRGFTQPTPMRNGMDTLGESNFYGTGTVERIEVVKGPSAILYGITEPGGLINVVTKKPMYSPYGSVSLQAGDFSTLRAEVDYTGPVGSADTGLAFRVIGVYSDFGYEMPFAYDKIKTIAPSVKYQFSENTSLLAALEYQELRSVQRGTTIIKVGTEEHGELEGERVGFIQGNYYNLPKYYNHEGPDSHKDTDTRFASLDFQHEFLDDRFAFRAVLNHSDNYIDQDVRIQYGLERVGPDDQLGWVRTGYLARFVDREELTFQSELNGKFETGPIDHNFLVGYEHTDFEQTQVAWRENNALPLIDLKDPSTWNFDITIPPYERSINPANFVRDQDTWSAYGVHQMTMFNDRLHTLLGIRYDVVNASTTDNKADPPSVSDEPETTNTTPQGGVLFDVTNNLSVFGSYSESFTPNVQVNPDGGTFAPATGEGYDFGIKFNTEDNRYNATISVFEIEKTNIVRRDSEKSEELEGLWFNTSGLERSEGYEIDIIMTPVDNYQITLSYAYVDAYIVSNTDNPELEGRQIRDSPKHSYSLWNKYTFTDDVLEGAYIGAGIVSRDNAKIAENLVNRYMSYPSYTVLDVVFGYKLDLNGAEWDFAVKVFNLTDEWYMDRQRRIANGRNIQFYTTVKF